jgi:hypothetical protein
MRRHIDGWRPSSGVLVGVLALVAAVAGTAVAGPTATTSKLSKKKVVKIADQEINKLAPGLSVAHAESANTANTATNADNAVSADTALSAQSALSADTADSVGGVSIEPVRMSVPDGAPETTVVSVDGTFVSVSNCGSGQITLRVGRPSSTSPTITTEWITSAGGATVTHTPPGNFLSNNFAAIGLSASMRQASGRVTRVFIEGFYEQNAFGGTDDCFVQGTIERFG